MKTSNNRLQAIAAKRRLSLIHDVGDMMKMRIYILLFTACLLSGCGGYSKSYVVRNAEQLRAEAQALISSPERGRIEANQLPKSIAALEPREAYVSDTSVLLITDGWNPSNGLIIAPDPNLTASAEVARNGRVEKQLAPGIVRFEYGPKPNRE